jgi:predicted NUDIX family NTP pyrophosphohydrolase
VNGSCVPEVDRAAWFTLDEARVKIIKGQGVFLDRLEQILRRDILYVEEEL